MLEAVQREHYSERSHYTGDNRARVLKLEIHAQRSHRKGINAISWVRERHQQKLSERGFDWNESLVSGMQDYFGAVNSSNRSAFQLREQIALVARDDFN